MPKARLLISSIMATCLLVSTPKSQAISQLDAPGAISNFSGCKHHTCIWVPWSTQAVYQKGELTYTVEVPKDDDQDGGEFVLKHNNKELLRTELKKLLASVSVVWAPDARSFAITWSDGGAIGNFHVRAFRIQDDKVTELPVVEKAFQHFKSRHWCAERGDNIQAYRWTQDSHSLVLVLSVYPTSDCGKQMGHMEGYVVEAVTGRILQNWPAARLKSYLRSHPEL